MDELIITLSYRIPGEYLTKRGKYRSAVISKVNGEYITDKNLATLESAEYADCTQAVKLGNAFIEHALERPTPPKSKDSYHRWSRTDMGKLYIEWKKLNNAQKIKRHIEMYVRDLTGQLEPEFSYDII